MSRVGKSPVNIPAGVEVNVDGQAVRVKGPKGVLELNVHPDVQVSKEDTVVKFSCRNELADALSGTMRSLLNGMVEGVSRGFERKLLLVGVGYRAQLKGDALGLTLGFSHPVDFNIPTGISIETPTQTEIIVKGANKQLVGQVCANIRALRPPEAYKGKGIRYADETIVLKETKK